MHEKLSIIFLVLYTLGVVLIGLYNRGSKDSTDYFLGGRKLPAWLLAITFIASWWGGGSAIDLVDHAHDEGLASFWIYGVPVLIAAALMYFMAEFIRNESSISQPELFAHRYNATSGFLLTLFILIFMIIAAAVQVIVIGHFFQSFFHITYTQGALIGTAIVLFYSLFGGFKGVVLTDLLQFVFFMIGGLALFYYTWQQSGGLEAVTAKALLNKNPGYVTFWDHFPNYIAYVLTFGTSWAIQANVWQRISAARTPKSARQMIFISFFAFIPLYLMVTYTGMFTSILYDTVPSGGIVPHLVKQFKNPWISAFIFVGLCSAIMSTMDSLLNTAALSLTNDIYDNYFNRHSEGKNNVLVGRLSTFLVAACAFFIGVRIESVLTISWIGADFLATGAFVPLILGIFWKRGNAAGAVACMSFGLLFSSYNLLVALGVNLPIGWTIASATQTCIGMLCSLLIYLTVSLLFHRHTLR